MYTALYFILLAVIYLTPKLTVVGLIAILLIQLYLIKKAFGWDLIKDIKNLVPLVKKLK
jgi:hypothetical protein